MFSEFTHLYPVTKTLRFELKPVGKTLAHIHAKGFLERDEKRAENYKRIKKTIDEYHKSFINTALADCQLDGLDEYCVLYSAPRQQQQTDAHKKALEKKQAELRKQVVAAFSAASYKTTFSEMFKKELLTKNLKQWVSEQPSEQQQTLFYVDDFEKFTTYFTGFHENRKNMYSAEEKHTAISYRLVHENLPKYIENKSSLEYIQANNPELYASLKAQIEREFNTFFSDEENQFLFEHLLDMAFYNRLLSQQGIDKYNTFIGGASGESGSKKTQGINELINLYNQKQDKNKRAPKLKPLYKQILSDKESISFLPEQFEDDQAVYDAINSYYRNHLLGTLDDEKNITALDALKEITTQIDKYNLNQVYLKNDKNLASISQRLFGDYGVFDRALDYLYRTEIDLNFEQNLARARSETAIKKLDKAKHDWLKNHHSIAIIEQAYANYVELLDADDKLKALNLRNPIQRYFSEYFTTVPDDKGKQPVDLVKAIDNKHSTIKGKLNASHEQGARELLQKHNDATNIKHFLDSIMELVHFVKPLALDASSTLEKDAHFYAEFIPLYDTLTLFYPLYNKVRNYISQKPFSIEKYKLNFDNAQLVNGWDANKEKDYLGVLLRKDGLYFLAILNKNYKKVFEQAPTGASGSYYEKMTYKLLPGPNKMLPKVFFAKSNIEYYAPSAELLENYKNGTHKKGDNFNLNHCHQLIDFFKQSIAKHKDWQHFEFNFSPTQSYNDLSDFYKEVAHDGYKVAFGDVNAQYIDSLVEQGKLYLFQIYNKDFSPKAHGKPNLHTLYFKALFSEANLADTVYKLNGEAELFYRKASLRVENTTVHKAGQPMRSKNPDTPENTRTLAYDIIKDKRYTVDKFLFHVPITMNFKADTVGAKQFNTLVREYIKQDASNDTHIIGIDRGERHLLYLTVVNQRGELVYQESLNSIVSDDERMTTPYHKLLDEKEKKRAEARVNWGVIENIKELKAGYLSQVVYRIAQLILQYNAIVVLEDLNFGFKRGRFKVEKQVYQKFEKALIDKLNYLVFKQNSDSEIGGLRSALQLTSPFTAFKDLGKQTGFLFYVPAWNTSKIDPTTGFVDYLKPKYENLTKAQAFFEQFEAIRFNKDKDYFEFGINYDNFHTRATGTRTHWVVCSHGGNRYVYDKTANLGKGGQKSVDVNAELKTLFEQCDIQYQTGEDLRPKIRLQTEKAFFSQLMFCLKALLAMRYSNAQTGEDFILSPVANEQGAFFDSRNSDDASRLPKDADANGAYHIALKGLWAVQQIKDCPDDKLANLKLAISNQDWLNFMQSKAYQG